MHNDSIRYSKSTQLVSGIGFESPHRSTNHEVQSSVKYLSPQIACDLATYIPVITKDGRHEAISSLLLFRKLTIFQGVGMVEGDLITKNQEPWSIPISAEALALIREFWYLTSSKEKAAISPKNPIENWLSVPIRISGSQRGTAKKYTIGPTEDTSTAILEKVLHDAFGHSMGKDASIEAIKRRMKELVYAAGYFNERKLLDSKNFAYVIQVFMARCTNLIYDATGCVLLNPNLYTEQSRKAIALFLDMLFWMEWPLKVEFDSVSADNSENVQKFMTTANVFSLTIQSSNLESIFPYVLVNSKVLTKLSISVDCLGEEIAKALAGALEKNTTLAELNLRINDIGDEGAVAVAGALETNTTLAELNLGENDIGDEGAEAVAGALKKNTTLKKLNLMYNNIKEEGGVSLANALKKKISLSVLNLRGNYIGNLTVVALAKALVKSTTLTELDLHYNEFEHLGTKSLARALKKNTTLTVLTLSRNRIRFRGATAIADALKKNTTLTALNLYDNKIGNRGAVALADALGRNTTLTRLKLKDNRIGSQGAIALVHALKKNSSLTNLNLKRNSFATRGKRALENLKKTQPSLKITW